LPRSSTTTRFDPCYEGLPFWITIEHIDVVFSLVLDAVVIAAQNSEFGEVGFFEYLAIVGISENAWLATEALDMVYV
jgi:hypothetical protein